MIGKARHQAVEPNRIRSRQQEPTRRNEGALQLHLSAEQTGRVRRRLLRPE
ncbi:MAG TPA: hypothetical protein VHE78_17000 [Gemmatimonadaceae bacterium]|nr:hypothetical protein [Gemmatimonadaceae bacterium]